jgi:hypothetical protein
MNQRKWYCDRKRRVSGSGMLLLRVEKFTKSMTNNFWTHDGLRLILGLAVLCVSSSYWINHQPVQRQKHHYYSIFFNLLFLQLRHLFLKSSFSLRLVIDFSVDYHIMRSNSIYTLSVHQVSIRILKVYISIYP